MEIRFVEGKRKGQIWRFENYDIDDILEHYDELPMNVLRDSDIYIDSNQGVLEIDVFLKRYFEARKKYIN